MASSKVEIFNMALGIVGEASLTSDTENNSRARLMRSLYPISHKYVLASMDWPFARKFLQLQELEDVTTPDGIYAWGLPSDCVVPLDIHPRHSETEWYVMGEAIWTPLDEDVYLYYTWYITNPQKFSGTFDSVLADYMAAKICVPLTGDKDKAKSLMNDFYVNLRMAQAVDANMGSEYRHEHHDPDNDTFNQS